MELNGVTLKEGWWKLKFQDNGGGNGPWYQFKLGDAEDRGGVRGEITFTHDDIKPMLKLLKKFMELTEFNFNDANIMTHEDYGDNSELFEDDKTLIEQIEDKIKDKKK